MKRFGKALLVYVLGSLIADLAFTAVENVSDGKDIFGRKVNKKRTWVDYSGQIHLGQDDYQVV